MHEGSGGEAPAGVRRGGGPGLVVPAEGRRGVTAQVKVRLNGERTFRFLASGGRITRLQLHAVTFPSRDDATKVADDLLAHPDVAAVSVMQDGRRVYRAGEPTPAPVRYGPAAGYRFLTGKTAKGHPVFEARNPDGSFGHFSMDDYEAAVAEAKVAGLDTSRATVYGRTCGVVTHGLTFRQVVVR